jgi:uncharacterized membrane protein
MRNHSDQADSAHSRRARSIEELTRHNIEMIAKMETLANMQRSVGDRIADIFAATAGSWLFIVIQSIILVCWMILNIVAWTWHWDPYPFILLNLALSFQAAYAGPIVMMSQNRQMRLSERRHHLDLQINLLAEQETTEILRLLRKVCKKLDIVISDSNELILEQRTDPHKVILQIDEIGKPK